MKLIGLLLFASFVVFIGMMLGRFVSREHKKRRNWPNIADKYRDDYEWMEWNE